MSGRARPRREPPAPAAPVKLVGFGASWCAPWLLLQPALDAIEADGIAVERVDVDADAQRAETYRVVALPTFVIEYGPNAVRRLIGAVSGAELRKALARAR